MEILSSKNNGILTLEFNRPERKNAITAAMYQSMAVALTEAEGDTEVRAILIAGKADIFTAGNDLEDFMKNAPTSGAIEDRSVYKFMMALSGSTKPIVAAVAGNAVGIGTTLLMHCDLVYAADNAKFSMPFVQLGLCPEFGSSLLLTQIAGYPRAAEKLMLGEAFLAQEALEMGLVSKVLPVDELRAFAEGQAAKLVALPASSIRVTKELMKAARKAPTAEAIAAENVHFGKMLSAPEAKEAFMAFFQKRKPDFTQFV
ncbi:Enoyl-CoA hydratase/carnithine racemase [Duganella sacchari]|uniref:Enoyl-CoA hydratase/carnithine racemase n=1 Tax=Duganella sacchari TaxID=551987 RepID=A0A1M7QW21_9BURK|nr:MULTISPECIES: enoyl-CoA hydratase [Duganella]MYM28738.1 enoyl-CoA hydratase [Duganella sp. CY15W]SHN36105.1 Enoyl-CoA hydratase/carnithine racemase [Duganella sacchari]